MARLKVKYTEEVAPALFKKFGYKSTYIDGKPIEEYFHYKGTAKLVKYWSEGVQKTSSRMQSVMRTAIPSLPRIKPLAS